MGFVYGGLVGNITYPGVWMSEPWVAILSTVKGSPTTINTNQPHNLLTGDIVDITDHAVCTGINGVNFPVIVTSPTQFTIAVDTSTYTSGGATGNVYPRAYTANRTTIPVDGDPNAASTYAPFGMSNADQNAFAIYQTGAYRFAGGNLQPTVVNTDNTFTTSWAWVKKGSGGGGPINPVVLTSPSGGTPFGSLLRGGPLAVAGATDILECQLDFTWQIDNTGSDGTQTLFFALVAAYYVPGTVTPTFTLATNQLPQSAKSVIVPLGSVVGGIVQRGNVTLHSCFSVVGNLTLQGAGAVDNAGLFDVQLFAGQIFGTVGDANASMIGDAHCTCKIWRQNIVPQES